MNRRAVVTPIHAAYLRLRRLARRWKAFWFGRPVSHYTKHCSCDRCVDYRVARMLKRAVTSGAISKKDALLLGRVML